MGNERDTGTPSAHAGGYLGDPTVASRRLGAAREGGALLAIWRDAADALLEAAALTDGPFRAALLLGKAGNTAAGVVTEVRAWADLDRFENEAAFAAELITGWDQTVNRLARAHRGLVICGWACIRDGSGARLTDAAEMVHRTFFGLPWQVTLVVDPRAESLAFFGPSASGVLVNTGFNVLFRNKPTGEKDADS